MVDVHLASGFARCYHTYVHAMYMSITVHELYIIYFDLIMCAWRLCSYQIMYNNFPQQVMKSVSFICNVAMHFTGN